MNLGRTTWALAGALLTTLAFPASGMAVTGTVTEFSTNLTPDASPFGIAAGPDGNLWFTEQKIAKVGRITPNGTIKEFALPGGTSPNSIASLGPTTLYVTDQGANKVYLVQTNGPNDPTITPGTATLDGPKGIAAGPDGNLWVVNNGLNKGVQRVNPDGSALGAAIPTAGAANLQFIALGPDNNMWVTDFTAPGQLFKVNTAVNPPTASAVPLAASENLLGVAGGTDGKVYFTEAGGTPRISRINPDGSGYESTRKLDTGTSDPEGLAFGRDGNLYAAIFNGSKVGQITPLLGLTEFGNGITTNGGPRFIAQGPDGNMWFTEEGEPMSLTPHAAIGRITVDAPPPPPSGGGGTPSSGAAGGGGATNGTAPTTPVNNAGTPQVSEVAVKPSRFRVGARATAVSAKTGTTITFLLTKDATATLSFDQAVQGRRRGSGCVRINRRNINGRKCTRFIPRGTLTRAALQGPNAVPFTGRIGRRALKPGRYRVGVDGTDTEGRSGLFQYATFIVLPPKQKATRRGR